METEFVDWIIALHEGFPLDRQRGLVKKLKENPAKVELVVRLNLPQWQSQAAKELGRPVAVCDVHAASAQITQALKDHFLTK